MHSLAETIKKIRLIIPHVRIVAVTKFQPIEKIREAVACGILDLGVNYAQEGEKLQSELEDQGVCWHFIGNIQSRKTKYLPAYDLIQSIDRIEVLESLDKIAADSNTKSSILVEVNTGNELSKSGVTEESLESFLKAASLFKNIKVQGLMVMPPPLNPIELRRPFFKKSHAIFNKFKAAYGLEVLSMGTSEDYIVAVEEGSNMVRLGTCLFGPRPPR